MKAFSFLLATIILWGAMPCSSQNKTALSLTFDSSSFLQGSYAQKLKTYQEDPIHHNCIVFLGNSLTAGGIGLPIFPINRFSTEALGEMSRLDFCFV